MEKKYQTTRLCQWCMKSSKLENMFQDESGLYFCNKNCARILNEI